MIKICLLKNVPDIGNAGLIAEVSDGYAVNYLFPHKLARRATVQDEKRQEQLLEKKAAMERLREKILDYVRNTIEPMAAKTAVKVEVNALAGGKLNEPISQRQLVDAVQNQFKKLEVLHPDEFAFNLPSRLDYTGKYSFDLTVKPKGSEEEVTLPIIVDIVSVSKARRAVRSKDAPPK